MGIFDSAPDITPVRLKRLDLSIITSVGISSRYLSRQDLGLSRYRSHVYDDGQVMEIAHGSNPFAWQCLYHRDLPQWTGRNLRPPGRGKVAGVK